MTLKTGAFLTALLLLSGILAGCGGGTGGSGTEELAAKAERLVESMAAGEYAAAAEDFDSVMTDALPPEKLREAWESLILQNGEFKALAGVRSDKAGQYDVVFVTCEFEGADQDVKVVFNDEKQVSGLFFVRPEGEFAYQAPGYVDQDTFVEKEVTVGSGDWELPGTLTLPKGDGPFPAVVLVHGSGPNDRDETMGPNKVFRDLAWGLGSDGIAVLRYEKRTLEHQVAVMEDFGDLTVKEETVDDALAAASLLRETGGIDEDRIFVLGHSLGGMLVPRIAARDPGIHGFIILAGAARPLEDLILEQTDYICNLDGTVSEEEKAQLEEVENQVANVKDPGLSEETPAEELPTGFPAKYWLDLRGYQPAEAAKSMDRPVLILQGERDYQVTMDDYGLWERALSSDPDVTLESYPELNHLFMEGEGRSTPAEYEVAGHVSEVVIGDIASFVRSS